MKKMMKLCVRMVIVVWLPSARAPIWHLYSFGPTSQPRPTQPRPTGDFKSPLSHISFIETLNQHLRQPARPRSQKARSVLSNCTQYSSSWPTSKTLFHTWTSWMSSSTDSKMHCHLCSTTSMRGHLSYRYSTRPNCSPSPPIL